MPEDIVAHVARQEGTVTEVGRRIGELLTRHLDLDQPAPLLKADRTLERSDRTRRFQIEEHTRQQAEQVAREKRALELAAKSHAETRLQRIIAAWSFAVAVLALVAAVVVPLMVG